MIRASDENAEDLPVTCGEALYACREPLLIGVRHHSAAMARSIRSILDQFRPEQMLIELPHEFGGWIDYLADEETIAPVAISAVDADGNLAFYPMADFSPELVAIRWAKANNIPVIPCDLAVGLRTKCDIRDQSNTSASPEGDGLLFPEPDDWMENIPHDHQFGLLDELLRRTDSVDTGQLWERMVETPAIVAEVETVRRMGLLFGWAVRSSTHPIPTHDLFREAAMRESIRRSRGKTVAIVGAFHAAALLPEVVAVTGARDRRMLDSLQGDPQSVGVSLIPYSFAQLDQRSGYPAGISDPVWHQRIVQAADREEMDWAAVDLVVGICRELRRRGHVAGSPDASEVIRMMRDLARLRGLPVAGRGELIESLQCCLVQGELHGRARAVAAAAGKVLIGNRRGSVSPRTPRCGLEVSIESLLKSLGLPGESQEADKPKADRRGTDARGADQPKEIRLDVLRIPRDRARAVVLRQLAAARIPYGRRVDQQEQGNRENLAERWLVSWQQGTSATIASLARLGVTLPQVVEGILQQAARRDSAAGGQAAGAAGDANWEDLPPEAVLNQLEVATQCGLHGRVHACLGMLEGTFLQAAGLAELVAGATILGRIAAGHIPGLPTDASQEFPPIIRCFTSDSVQRIIPVLLRKSLDRLDGLEGSDDPADVAAICDLVEWFDSQSIGGVFSASISDAEVVEQQSLTSTGQTHLISWSRRTLDRGSDRMRGASAGILCLTGTLTAAELASLMGGWFDAAVDSDSRRRLRGCLAGAVQALLPRMQNDSVWLEGLESRLGQTRDQEFLRRLPALRGAFAEFSPADRERLLAVRLENYTERGTVFRSASADSFSVLDPTKQVAILREADLAGREAILNLIPGFTFSSTNNHIDSTPNNKINSDSTDGAGDLSSQLSRPGALKVEMAISIADRWRMILGLPPENPTSSMPAARSLDQLYGRGRGEGSRGGLSNRPRPGSKGGTEAPMPTPAQWADDLEKLFGSDVCQEVLGESVGQGNLSAIEALDPDTVSPSIALLKQILSLTGSMAEERSDKLRKIARRITESLAKRLAVRLQSALSGLSSPRATRRRAKKLNLSRTIRENLVNAHRRLDGRSTIVAKRLIFNSNVKREMDWHLTFVVDVSGSMSESVVYSALCAAIFAELPALSVRFLAFSTEVIDLTGHVSDPLSLLLEVQVGGGTDIGLGLRAARGGIKVPSRTIVILVSDFEEGVSLGQMLSEIRAIVESGAKCIGLAALDDSGTARFHQGYAQLAASAGMPVAAVSPERLAQWVGDQIRGNGQR